MTPLRRHMIAALQLSGKGERTQQAYVRAVRLLAQCYGTSPDLLSEQELQHYFLPRTNVDGLAPASMRLCSSAPPLQANSGRTPASAPRSVPNLWRTDVRRQAPVDLQPDLCRYQLRATTLTESSRFDMVCTPQRHPCVLRTPSGSKGPLMTGAKPTIETRQRFLFPLLTPTRRCLLLD